MLANDAGPIRGLTANSSRNVNARVGVAGFSTTGLNEVTGNGHSDYNAFTATLTRRFGRMFLQAAYTFSKSIDNNSGASTSDLGNSGGNNLWPPLERGLSDFDRTHRLQVTYSYAIRGFQNKMLGWITRGLGGGRYDYLSVGFAYQLHLLHLYHQRVWLNVRAVPESAWRLQPDPEVGRSPAVRRSRQYRVELRHHRRAAHLARGHRLRQRQPLRRSGHQHLHDRRRLDRRANNVGQLLGTLPRNPGIRGPFQQQWDLALTRSFPITEKLKLDLRGEFFNLFNHPVFAAANSTVGSAAFGRYTNTITAPRIVQVAAKIVF